MLRSNHEVSKLSNLAFRQRTANMTSLDVATDLTTTAMRSSFVAFNRVQSSRAIRPSIPNNISRTWNPHHGIEFSVGTALSLSASRPIHTSAMPAHENSSSDHSNAENISLRSVSSTFYSGTEDLYVEPVNTNNSDLEPSNAAPTSVTPVDFNEVSHTPLKFKIPEEVLGEMQKADPSNRYWSYALYRGPDGPDHKVKVHYCRSKHASEKVAQYFLDSDVLGFDIEWKPDSYRFSSPKQNVSLIQIANDEKVALFHVALFAKDNIEDLVPPTLKRIMENSNIIKVGVAIKGDCTRLRKHLNIDSKGIFELSNLYKLIKYSASGEYDKINKRLVNLASQVEEHLELPLFKGEVRESDWSQPLDLEQLAYAASDTYAGLRLFDVMEARRRELKPTPPRPYFSEQELPIRLADGVVLQSADEQAEELEPVSVTTRGKIPIDGASIKFEPDSAASTPISAKIMSKSAKKAKLQKAKAPQVIMAEEWVSEWKSSRPEKCVVKASNSPLRAYALWQHQNMQVEAMSALLGIQKATVASYIAEVIKLEKLPCEPEKLSKVLKYVPESVSSKRYRTLVADIRKSMLI